jgi:hypothetical protein
MRQRGTATGITEPYARRTFEDWLTACNRHPEPWLAVFAALLAMQISPWWYSTPDTVVYLSAARSIAVHHTFATLGNAQIVFPPGYPLLVSPAFLLGDRPFLMLSIIQWCMAVVLILGVYRWMRRVCPGGALLLTGLVLVNVSVWIHYRRTLSELAFMTVLIWAAQGLDAVREPKSLRSALVRALPASACVLLLSMIREVGLAVCVGFGAAVLIDTWRGRMRWPTALLLMSIVVAPASIAVAGFVRYDAAMKVASSAPLGTHLDGLMNPTATLVWRLTEGLRLRISEVGRLLIPGMFNAYGRPGNWLDLNVIVYVPVFVLVAVGWWRFVRRRTDVFALTLPCYVLAYILWPFEAGTRYMLPMLPVLLGSVWCLIEPLRQWRLTLLAILLVGHLGVAMGHWIIKDIPRARTCHAQWGSVEQLVSGLGGDSRVTLSAHLPPCVHFMLELSLDRLLQVSQRGDGDRDAQWMVTPEAEPDVAGFAVSLHAAPYKLLTRDPAR